MDREAVLIGASMAALVVLSVFVFAYFCSNRQQRHAAGGGGDGEDVELGRRRPGVAAGLDEAVIAAYPTAVYKSRLDDGDQAAAAAPTKTASAAAAAGGEHRPLPDIDVGTLCAVCLVDYTDGDELRWLPGCRHAFHQPCIDQWLRRRPTCPVCRTAPPTAAD